MPKWVAEQNAKKKKNEKKIVYKPKADSGKRSQSSSVSQQQRINQKMYGQPDKPTYNNRRRETSTFSRRADSNTTAAQRQKMGMQTSEDLRRASESRKNLANNVRNYVKDSMSEDNRSFAQRQKSGTLTEQDERKVQRMNERRTDVVRNTGAAAKKAVLDTGSGYAQTLYDVTDLTASNKNGTRAKAMKMGIDPDKDKNQMAELERERKYTAEESKRRRDALFSKQEQRQAQWDERTKNAKGLEKAWYGAVESGTGMLADTLVGAATGTGQFGALASMGLRTYGSSANQARKEGATDTEARLYGLAQAGKEMGTELMFQGAGLAKQAYSKGGKVGLSFADKAANALTKGLTGARADAVGAGVKVLGGTAEENVEELAGWALDPLIKELTYGKNVRQRNIREQLRANIPQIGSKEDADRVASYFSTSQFTDDLIDDYVKSGMTKDQATELADELRDYYVAYYSGDEEKLEEIEADLSEKLAKEQGLSKEDWSREELLDTFASTTLLTLATGLPGAVTTSVKGNQIFDNEQVKSLFGDNAVQKVADAVENTSDEEMSVKASAMKERLESGKDLTGTQKYELWQGFIKKSQDTEKKAAASYGVVENAMRDQDLVPTIGVDKAGNRVYAKETQKAFNEKYASTELTVEAIKNYMESENSISDDDARRANAVKKAVSDLHVGGLTVGDAHEFAYGSDLAREALKAEEGIDLDQYIVRYADGTVNYAATNEATENALFQINADNAIASAQVETEVYIDEKRGDIDKDLLSRFGNNGQAIWKEVNKDLDPRNLNEYLTTANATSYFYSAGRNTDMSVDEAISNYANTFKTVDNTVLKRAFAAGARDRIIANTPGYGQTVKAGSNISLKKTKPILTGQLIMDKDVNISDSDQSAYLALAMATNTNIHIVSELKSKTGAEINGMSHGNDIYLNMNVAAEANLGYVFMHEMTHQIKQYAPNEYLALENLVRDRWFNKDQKGMQKAIKDRIALYSEKGGQQLTEEEAVEEIIADAMAEAMDDPDFAAQVCEENLDLGQAILNSIRAALRSIRQMFANTEFRNDRFHNSLLSYLGILDEAEKMWLNALATAKQNKANGLIADWQDRANKQNSPRLSLQTLDDGSQYVKLDGNLFLKDDGTEMTPREAFNALVGKQITLNDGDTVTFIKKLPNRFDGYNELFRRIPKNKGFNDLQEVKDINEAINKNIEEVLQASENISPNEADAGGRHAKYNIQNFDTREVYVADDNAAYRVELSIATMTDGTKFAYAKKFIEPDNSLLQKIKKAETTSNNSRLNQSSANNISSLPEKSKFSISEPVERVKDLIAVHNLKPDDIRNTFDLGGFPMPSIAVTKDSMGHDMYGDITLMFNSDTIDPKFFKSNQVFGGDAYTPTFPATQYKPNEDIVEKFRDIYYDNAKTLGYDAMRPFYELAEDAENALNRNGGEQGLIDRYKNDVRAMRTFLKINGKDVEDVVKRTEDTISETEQKLRQHFIDTLGEDAIREFEGESIPHGKAMMDHRKNWTYEHSDGIKSAYRDFLNREFSFSDEEISNVLDNMSLFETMKLVRNALNYLNDGATTVKEEIDRAATDKAIEDAAHELGYEEWIDGLLTGIEEKRGIRNNKEFFTRTGNRRSWDTLHDDITLENVVRVMRSELAAGGNGFLWKNPKGAAQKQYKNLDEIRADENRLQQLPEEEYKALEQAATQKLSDVLSDVVDNNPGRFMNSFGAVLDTGEYIAEILNETRDKDTMQRKLKKDYSLDVSDEQMDRIAEAIDEIANIPTGYFEAKPRRAVGFDEVKAAIIPQNTDEDIKTGLSERGISTYEYDPEVEGDRTQKINDAASENDLRFSISNKYDDAYMDAVNSGNMDEAQRLVDEAAREAGYTERVYHGTGANFTVFDFNKSGNNHGGYSKYGKGFYFSDSEETANYWGKDRKLIHAYINLQNPYDASGVISDGVLFDKYTELRNKWKLPRREEEIASVVIETLNEHFGRGYTTDLLKEHGYDGVVARHPEPRNEYSKAPWSGTTEYIVFDAENIKSADPVTYDIGYKENGNRTKRVIPLSERFDPTNDDIRYSLPTQDSDGNILTDGQMEYFKNSQARDEQGRLMPLYHGTQNGGFTIFDSRYGISSRYFFFVDSMSAAKGYSGSEKTFSESVAGEEDMRLNYKVYLDMVNPLIVDAQGNSWVNIPYEDDFVTTNWLAEYAESEGYDGVIVKNVIDRGSADTEYAPQTDYIVFNSNQIKDTRNENPTENPDIRYSITPEDEAMEWLATQYELDDVPLDDEQAEEGRVRMAKSKKDFIKSKNALWNERWLTEGKIINVKSVRKNIKDLVTGVMANSDTDHKYKSEVVDKTLTDAKSAYWLMKEGKHSEAAELLWNSAVRMIENVDFIEDTTFKQYKDLRDYMRTTSFKLGEEYWSDVDFSAFRKRNFGRIKLVKGETNIDEIYQELQEKWGEWFDEDEQMTAPDQLLRIEEVLDTIQPYKIAYSSEEAEQLAGDIADTLYDIVYQGEEYKSIADTFKERYDAKTKALKARHEEALAKVRTRRDELLAAEKEKTSRQKERAELWKSRTFEEKAKRQKDKDVRKKAKYFGKISDNIDWLTTRLLNETKDKNIPEGFRKSLAHMLMQFDMQTEKSKALEEKYGPAKKTLQMRELKSRLEKIANEDDTGEFRYDGYLFYLMDALAEKVDGKSIDALDTEDLIAIDTMLKSIVHNFRNYNKIRLEEEKVAIANIGDNIIEAMDERIKKYGKRKTYGSSVRGYLDRLVNEGEETPIYFFERLDPTGQGIGAMYKELRRGEDRHIQNMNFLRNRFQAMFSDYFNEKKPGSKLEGWRDTSQAQTFNLKNGPITLNPAQIMSLYCLSKRPQAMGHILGSGIVASPISFGAKMKEKLKGNEEQVDSVMIEYSEVQEIIATLSEEQMRLADEMQSLMNNEMAAWGNETSLELHGIKLFRENDYFPIKSSNEELQKSADKKDVNEKIKNFGFTKPLVRNANNAIMIDDIFSVVADHCNKMSLYNSMAIPITDFMRVYNYKQRREGEKPRTVQAVIGEAFTRKANEYITKFISDVNGNTRTRSDAVDSLMNKALANYKKASIGFNGRVALQQPTAIFRARMVIDGKYFVGTKLISPKNQREMFEHCPIALWKSWGHYDMDMGRDIEDIMMNNDWSKFDTVTMGAYGLLDNMAWGKIWQAVKNEIKAKHPEVTVGSNEFFRLCNERASEVFDKTQVVDSIFHRSDTMRSKNTLTKMATSFMAEPTLTYNVFRDSIVKAREMVKDGDVTGAAKLLRKMMGVLLLNAAAVSASAAIWDVVRGKGADDDDDDETLMEKGLMALVTKLGGTDPWTKDDKSATDLWLINTLNNFSDNAPWAQWNNIYFVKDIVSLKDGWGTSNMALEGWETLFKGFSQAKKKLTEGSDKSWYDIWMNIAGGLGYVTGYPVKTFMRDAKAILEKFGVEVMAADGSDSDKSTGLMDAIADKMGYSPIDKKGSSKVKAKGSLLARLGIGKTEEEKEQDAFDKKTQEIADKYADLSGEERDKKVWSSVTSYLKDENDGRGIADMVSSAEYGTINEYKKMYLAAGGDAEYFDGRIYDLSKSAMKKTIVYDATDEQIEQQEHIKEYLLSNGMDESELSEIVYKSDMAKDMKVAFRLGDRELMLETLRPLIRAGLTYDDFVRIWDNRNRIQLSSYKGRYKDKLKSTGQFIWPTDGVITSHFGYRNAPTAGASSNHPAIDIGAPQGTAVVAADGGVVISAGANGGYGNSVGIKHDNGMITWYNHLYSWNVKEGDTVAQGQQIAQVGSTGISTGPHLDFKILDVDGNPVDPEKYLNKKI